MCLHFLKSKKQDLEDCLQLGPEFEGLGKLLSITQHRRGRAIEPPELQPRVAQDHLRGRPLFGPGFQQPADQVAEMLVDPPGHLQVKELYLRVYRGDCYIVERKISLSTRGYRKS